MRKLLIGLSAGWAIVLTVSLFPPMKSAMLELCPVRSNGVPEAGAVSQFSRRYGVSCNACHTAFPRLNDFGERFKFNGYQMPDTQDGNDAGQEVGDRLTVQELGNLFGLRLAFSPLTVKTESRTIRGKDRSSVDIGQVDWLQFFTAGSIYKNVSIFIETEIDARSANTVKNNWFYLGFHNLFGTKNGKLNTRVGKIPQMDFHTSSGRLRMIPNIKIETISNVKSSGGNGEDSVSLSSAYPGAEVFGLAGPIVYSAGATNGDDNVNEDNELNYFGTVGYRVKDGALAGSQISVYGMSGVDSSVSTSTNKTRNAFYRLSPGINVRVGASDFIFTYVYGQDENWNLVTNPQDVDETKFRGISAQYGYTINPTWWAGIQYDAIDSADVKSLEYSKVSPSLWYFPQDNLRVGVTARIDTESKSATYSHTEKVDEYLVHLRTMF